MKELENLRALVYGEELNSYQKALAIQEFEQLTNPQPSEIKDVNWMDNDWSYQDDEWGDGEDIKWDNDAIEFAEWISVKDRLPKEYCHCLIYCPSSFPKNIRVLSATFYDDNNMFYCDASEMPHEDVTHWMPLPEPPKQ